MLDRLGISGAKWLKLVTEYDRLEFDRPFTSVVISAEKLLARASTAGPTFAGQVACREAFG
jgi:hypothetical protein